MGREGEIERESDIARESEKESVLNVSSIGRREEANGDQFM